MLKRLAVIGAVIGAFGAPAAFAEPTLEMSTAPSAGTASSSMATATQEAFKPTAATKPAVLWDPNSHENTNP